MYILYDIGCAANAYVTRLSDDTRRQNPKCMDADIAGHAKTKARHDFVLIHSAINYKKQINVM